MKNVDVTVDSFSNIEICSICGIAMGEFNLPAGTILGGFQIEAELYHDALGTVYKARQLNLERNVALKTLSPQLAQDIDFVDHFFEQARVAAVLNHPNIVQIFDAGSTPEGIYYLATELVEGEKLASRIKREGSLPLEAALIIAGSIADALAHSWEKLQICHGDIKPSNIIMNSSGEPKLSDLGLINTQPSDKSMTAQQMLYMAPELLSGEISRPNQKSDIYSLGTVMYQMLAGAPPFPESDPEKLYHNQLNDQPPDLLKRNSEVDQDTAKLINMMLSKDPAKRPDSWQDTVARIEELLLNRESIQQNSGGTAHHSADNRLQKLIIALACGVLILSVFAAGLYFTRQKSPAPPSAENEQRKLAAKWEKLKASTKFLTPANAIKSVEKYIEDEKNNVPPDAQAYLDYLKKKKADDDALNESKKEFNTGIVKLKETLKEQNIDSLSFVRLKELKTKINSLIARSKEPAFLNILTDKDTESFNSKLKNIDEALAKLKTQEIKKLAKEESERLRKENESEKQSRLEYDQKKQQIIQENIISDAYVMMIHDMIKNPSTKPSIAQMAQIRDELRTLADDKIPAQIREQLDTIQTVIDSPMGFIEIMAKCDKLFKGVSIPVKSLQEQGYKIDGADTTGIKLMLESEQAKIGKKIKWNTLRNEEFFEVVKQVLLSPANSEKISTELQKSIILNLLLSNKRQEAESLLSKIQEITDDEKKKWQNIISFFASLEDEAAATIIWHDISKNKEIPELLKKLLSRQKCAYPEQPNSETDISQFEKLIFFNSKFADTNCYQRYSFLVVDFLNGSDTPQLQALSLLKKMEPELKSGNIYKALDLVMTTQARYGNAIKSSKDFSAFLTKQKSSVMSRIRGASSVKSENDNRLPFYCWENEIPGDALIYRNILAQNKIIQSSTMLACITVSAEISTGDWNNARKFIKNNRNFSELASTKGTYVNWIPPLLFGTALIAERYNDSRLLSELSESLENVSRLSDDNETRPLASALAMELFITARNPASAISMAESYKMPNQPSPDDAKPALLHLLALLQQENINANEFSQKLDSYQKIFAKEQSVKCDFLWCRFIANMLKSNELPAPQEIDALEKLDCNSKNICAVMLADALAAKIYRNQSLIKEPATQRILRILSAKVTNNIAGSGLLEKIRLLKLSIAASSAESLSRAVDDGLADTRIASITSYPQLSIFKSAVNILKNPNIGNTEKTALSKILEASPLPSDAELYCPNLIDSDASTEYIKNMLSNNSFQHAFTAAAFNIMANADTSKTAQDTIKILNDYPVALSLQERLFIKRLETLLK